MEILVRTRAPYVLREGELVEQPEDEIWVRGREGVRQLAESIVEALEHLPYVDLACIGAATVNIGIKAIAVAREIVGEDGTDLYSQPYFSTIADESYDDGEKTRMVIRVAKVFVG